MPLSSGTRLGPYEITAALGAGGMGEVYRARDSRLGRDVAIKVLPGEVAGDPERRARFEREAKAVAALDHPHICAIYDVGWADGTHYLVMPLLDGQTLAARLEKGPLPIADALTVAGEIADALDKAHRQGIVHRDLKPANVMLTKSGVKLLDFGLAKLRPVAGALALSDPKSATTTAGTAEGTILGTIHYMSPEQVEGKEADHRADIWALGAVLYEMVTGERPFQGDTAASVMGAILRGTPPALSARQALSPLELDRIVATCLEKAPDERWQTARDLARQIRWVFDAPSTGARQSTAARPPISRRAWFSPLLAVAAFVVGVWLARSQGGTPDGVRDVRFTIQPEPGTSLAVLTGSVVAPTVAVSPDGRHVAFPAVSEGRTRLWVRDLSATTSRVLPGTEDVRYHFWAPDSRSLGFTARGKLRAVGLDGALPVDRATINRTARGGTWTRDGSILVNRSPNSGLFRVLPDGTFGSLFPATDGREPVDLFPFAMGDGRHVLFVHRDTDEQQRGLYIATTTGEHRTRLVESGWGPVAIGNDVLYLRGQTLVTQRVDLQARRLVGEPVVVLDAVANSTGGYMAASISETGVLAYAEPLATTGALTWFARNGNAVGEPIAPTGDYVDFSLSPAGDQVLFSRIDGQSSVGDLWLLDTNRHVTTRFTTDPQNDSGGTWTPDGERVLFRSNRNGVNELFLKHVTGGRPEVPLVEKAAGALTLVVRGEPAPDAGHFVVTVAGETIDVVDLDTSTGRVRPVADSPFDEYHASLSPDGRWLALVSEETGTPEVYIQSYPNADRRIKVSADGGSEPLWRGDGRELFYLRADRSLMAVAVSDARTLSLGTPEVLFRTRVPVAPNAYRRQYAVSKDGQRFLVNSAPLTARPPALHVVLDWRALLPRSPQ